MTPAEKETIRAQTNIVDLVSGYTTLRASGRKFKAVCPFHSEKTPSFHVDPDAGTWRCFGACGIGGDVFSFLMRAEGLTFPEAAERLAERAGIKLTSRSGDTAVFQHAQDARDRLWAACAAAQRFFQAEFQRNASVQRYAEQRQLAPETLANFGIGYAPDEWSLLAPFLQKDKVHSEDSEKAGLILPSLRNDGTFTDRFRARLMFPIYDMQERIIGFGGRLIAPSETAPKYLNSPETPIFSKRRTLYGLNRARKAIRDKDRIVVVEGYMDVVAAHQAGIDYVVATLGTSLSDDHIQLIRRYTKNVILSFDADAAGLKAAQRAVELFSGIGDDFNLRVLTLPNGEDPDSLLRGGNPSPFLRALDASLTLTEFRLRVVEVKHDLQTENGRTAYLTEALKVVAQANSTIEQDALLRRLAPLHPLYVRGGGLAEQSLRQEINQIRQSPVKPTALQPVRTVSAPVILPDERTLERPKPIPKPRTATEKAELTLIRAYADSNFAPHLLKTPLHGFFSPFYAPIAASLSDLGLRGIEGSQAVAQMNDMALQETTRALLMAAGEEPLSKEVIDDCIELLRRDSIRRELQEMQSSRSEPSDAELRKWQESSLRSKGILPEPVSKEGH